MSEQAVLSIRDLSVSIDSAHGEVRPLAGVSFDIQKGETFVLLGESGCGKSMTALTLMRLLPDGGRVTAGSVQLGASELLGLTESEMQIIRGGDIAMIFQEPSTSLNPVLTVGTQITEVLRAHRNLSGEPARQEAENLLRAVGIPDPARRLTEYPFQLSGGMKQRVMIACALAGNPELLIADEPTTALDVTIQAQVLEVLAKLQRERGMGMLLITHDLGVVAKVAERVGVMYAGELVEVASRDQFFRAPAHPYSRKLFEALPEGKRNGGPLATLPGRVPALNQTFVGCRFADRCPAVMTRCRQEEPAWHTAPDGQQVRCHLFDEQTASTLVNQQTAYRAAAVSDSAAPPLDGDANNSGRALLEVRDLKVHFPIRRGIFQRVVGYVRAVDGISLALYAGKTLALVGESGCGKTTTGKALLNLIPATSGDLRIHGERVDPRNRQAWKTLRATLQMVFQDPFGSLNPRLRVGEIIEEGLLALNLEPDPHARRARLAALLDQVGLTAEMMDRYPHEFSGGQRQRIALARALAVNPRIIVCDEPTSALDVSVQAQVLNLMRELQQKLGLAYLFITHNISVVEYLADEVAVMYLGEIVEHGPAESVLKSPRHPYTQALLAAVPRVDDVGEYSRKLNAPPLHGDIPSPANPPSGCRFHTRCPMAVARCSEEIPLAVLADDGHTARCHFVTPKASKDRA